MWFRETILPPSEKVADAALAHQNQLTKPPGSLGQLETLAISLCAMQGSLRPAMDKVAIRIFAADHGVVEEGVSAFPQPVTAEMVKNFLKGGAAISVLARANHADFAVVDMGMTTRLSLDGLINYAVANGTHNFCRQPAMSSAQFMCALEAGRNVAEEAALEGAHCFIGGEMGIGNTTAAAALACGLLNQVPVDMVGFGTGVSEAGYQRKLVAVERALKLHAGAFGQPEILAQCLGGFEIIALAGAYLQSASMRIAVLVDGFICTVAALLACQLNPGLRPWLLFAHQGAELGHQRVLDALSAKPLLALELRLGEGSGAGVALPLLKLACELHNGMATFSEAGLSEQEDMR